MSFPVVADHKGTMAMFSQACVCHSVHNRLHGYSFTAHPCYGAVGTHSTGMLSCFILVSEKSRNHMETAGKTTHMS